MFRRPQFRTFTLNAAAGHCRWQGRARTRAVAVCFALHTRALADALRAPLPPSASSATFLLPFAAELPASLRGDPALHQVIFSILNTQSRNLTL